MSDSTTKFPPLPADDLQRSLTFSNPDTDQTLPHVGLAGNTYTITVSGKDTNGRFCVVDMHVPPGGGPASHRHDCEETFIMLEGEVEATFRGKKHVVRAGETINIPANAPHRFQNISDAPARLLCICSPAGPGGSLQRSWRPGCHANHSASEARQGATTTIDREGEGARAQVPHGTSHGSVARC